MKKLMMVVATAFVVALSLVADAFTFGGDADWTDEGNGVWKSGSISDGQSSYAEMSVVGPVAVSFKWKTSSESGCDWLTFAVDGGDLNGISGEMGAWEKVSFKIADDGEHVLMWSFSKDGSVSNGEDCGWIKDVIVAPIRSFTGTLNANGGALADGRESNSVADLDLADLPAPTRSGYNFLGWFTAAYGGNEVTIATTTTTDMTLYAHWEEITYTYNYIDNGDGTVTLSRYDANGNWVAEPIEPSPVGEFEIPSELDGKTVVAIGSDYFNGSGMTSIVIPASVTNLTVVAFYNASGLTNITVDVDNPAYKSEDGILYTKDGKTLVCCPRAKGGDIVVASGTECVGSYAFYNNNYLTSVSLPAGLESIEAYAFYWCQNDSFVSVAIPASVEYIGANAFGHCSNLATVNFLGTESDIDIDDTAFIATPYDAAKPFELIVNEYGNLVGIHGIAPTNLVISSYLNGQTLTGIGDSALSGETYDMSSVTNVVVPEGVTYLGNYAFSGCSALEGVTLPTSLQSIYYGAFQDCTSLREITIPSGVTYVDNPFWGCENLTVHAPDTLEGTFYEPEGCTMDYYAVPQHAVTFNANGGTVDGEATAEWTLYEGRRLDSVDEYYVYYDLPTPTRNGYNFLGWFTAATGGTEVTADTVVTGDMTLYAQWEKVYVVTFDANGGWVEEYDEWNGYYPVSEVAWTVPEGQSFGSVPYAWPDSDGYFAGWFDANGAEFTANTVVTNDMTVMARWIVDDGTFRLVVVDGVLVKCFGECPATLSASDFPAGVTSIAYEAFRNKTTLTGVELPATVTNIDAYAFADCNDLAQITLNNGLEAIGAYAFAWCYALTNVVVPASVEAIGYYAFYSSGLEAVEFNGNIANLDDFAFYNTPYELSKPFEMIVDDCTVTGVHGTCPATLSASDFPLGVTSIGYEAFRYQSTLTGVELPATVTNIDAFAFSECNNLAQITLNNGLEAIGAYAFAWCYSFTNVVVPASVESIGYYAFGSSGLEAVSFVGGSEGIGIDPGAFNFTPWGDINMPFVFRMNYPGTEIYGWSGGNRPQRLEIPAGVTSISSDSFSGVSDWRELFVPVSVEYIGNSAFSWCQNLVRAYLPKALEGEIDEEYVFYGSPVSVYYYEGDAPTFVTVTLNAGAGSVEESAISVVPNNAIGTLPEASRSGYNFLGWFTAASGGTEVTAATVVTDDMTVYAHWEKVPVVTFNANGGTVDGEATACWTIPSGQVIGWEYGILPEPFRNGYNFLGWFTAAEGGNAVTADTAVTGDMTLYAHWEEITYTYNYIDNGDGTVTLSRYDANGNWVAEPIEPSPVGEFEIPSELDGKTVVSVGSDYFSDCYGMTSISIPASVTNLTVVAFYNASGLTNITVAADNPAYKSVDGILYTKDGKVLVACPRSKGGDIVVASGTECVGHNAFYVNDYLTSVTFPAGLGRIEYSAFCYCQNVNFASVVIPASVEYIGDNAFTYCARLATVTFDGVEDDIAIAATAFIGTPYNDAKPFALIVNEHGDLVGIHGVAPENLVISNCMNGAAVTGIGSRSLCDWDFSTSCLTNVVVPEGVTHLGDYAFAGDTSLESVTLPTSLQNLGFGVFSGCASLHEITIPSGVSYIENGAFDGCANMTIHVPSMLEGTFYEPEGCTMDYYAVPQHAVTFNATGGTVDGEATAAWTIYEGRRLDSADEYYVYYDLPTPTRNGYAFLGWFTAATGGTEVTADTAVTGDMTLYAHWEEITYTYNYIDNGDGTVTLSCWDEYGNWLGGMSPSPVGDFILPTEIDGKTVVAIGSDYFNGDGMTSIFIPASVTNISVYALYCAHVLTNITVAEANPAYKSVDGILYTKDGKILVACPRAKGGDIVVASGTECVGCYAFYGNSNLTSVFLPAGLEGIEDYAFEYCQNAGFTSVAIPASVDAIGQYAFCYCSSLTNVTFSGDESQIRIAATAFIGTPYNAAKPFSLIVDEWGNLAGIHGIAPTNLVISSYLNGQTLTGIGGSALSGYTYNTSSVTNIIVPDGVTWIGNYAFSGCSALEGVTLPMSLQNLGFGVFSGCASLHEITIPSGVSYIENGAFDGCANMTIHVPSMLEGTFYEPEGCTMDYYAVPQHTVTFDANGGTVDGEATETLSIYEGRVLGQDGYDEWGNWGRWLPAPTRNGYSFLGWFTVATGGTEVTADTVVTGDMTVYAQWAKVPVVTFDANGGTISGEATYETTVLEGQTFNMWQISTPYREGYDFAGWFNESGKRVSSSFVVTGDVTLTARWLEESPWYYDKVNISTNDVAQWVVTVSGAKDHSVIVNGVLAIPAALPVITDDGEEVALPVAVIDYYAFDNWPIETLVLPASMLALFERAFGHCSSLTSVTFEGGAGSVIGIARAFYGTPWLNAQPFTFETQEKDGEVYLIGCYGSPMPKETLVIPNGVTFLYSNALPYWGTEWDGERYRQFLGWYTAAEGGDKVSSGSGCIFCGDGEPSAVPVTGGTTLYAHWETVEPEWDFYIEEDGTATITGNSVSLVDDVEIPASVTVEEDDGAGNVTELTYPVTVIGDRALAGMEITAVTIPSSVTNIQDWAFEDCYGLTNVVFAGGMAGVKMRAVSAFSGTPWLEAYRSSLSVPDNDDFAGAAAISGVSGSVVGTTLNSSRETNDLIPDEYDYTCPATVWYRWIAPTNGTFVFSVADADPYYDWSCAIGATTGYDAENACWGDVSVDWGTLEIDATVGGEYWIEVGSYREVGYSEEFNFILSWELYESQADIVVDAGDGKSVTVPRGWIAEHSALVAAAGGDASAALAASAANGRKVWECYVVGLDPENGDATNDFRIVSFPMKADGTPDIEHIVFDPPQMKWNVPATYKVKGATNLSDTDWPEVTEGNKANLRFFKVEVVLP